MHLENVFEVFIFLFFIFDYFFCAQIGAYLMTGYITGTNFCLISGVNAIKMKPPHLNSHLMY